MGNQISSPGRRRSFGGDNVGSSSNDHTTNAGSGDFDDISRFRSFPGSAILEKTFCGSIDTTDPSEYEDVGIAGRILKRAEILCVSSPISSGDEYHQGHHDHETNSLFSTSGNAKSPSKYGGGRSIHPSSAMFARALVSEVTDNPKTMKPVEMAAREKKLLKAQEAANRHAAAKQAEGTSYNNYTNHPSSSFMNSRPVGTPGGVGPPNVFGSLAYACTGDEAAATVCTNDETQRHVTAFLAPEVEYPLDVIEQRVAGGSNGSIGPPASPYQVTIGLSLSRRHSGIGHPDTVTRQTAFDFNELQDRQYRYVSSTDQHGWRAGGGEPGGLIHYSNSDISDSGSPAHGSNRYQQQQQQPEKQASPDTVHIPIIQIDCPNQEAVDGVITALASGEIFIPHMAITPEALSVSGASPPDLVVRFGCERNDDIPADDWPNWCLEFMHNQLYEYFYNYGARWMKRPFSVTIAKAVRWKTVKHMNRYFAHAERVIDGWREHKGPQYCDPQLSYIDGGATPEEVARPHGIYLYRAGNANPTNYFCPNIDPPYTTKMTRSLLLAVLNKSWDKKRREWTSDPMPRLVEPATLVAAACGCADPTAGGFMAKEVTNKNNNNTSSYGSSNHVVPVGALTSPTPMNASARKHHKPLSKADKEDHENKDNSRKKQQEIVEFDRNHVAEEKKSDDPVTLVSLNKKQHNNSKRYNNSMNSSSNTLTDDEGPHSVAASAYDTSVAASGTTVVRTNTTTHHNNNSSNQKIINQEPRLFGMNSKSGGKKTINNVVETTVEKTLFSDEDWDPNDITPRTAAPTHDEDDGSHDFIASSKQQHQNHQKRGNVSSQPSPTKHATSNDERKNDKQESSRLFAAESEASTNFNGNNEDRYITPHEKDSSVSNRFSDTEDEDDRYAEYSSNNVVLQEHQKSPGEALHRDQQKQTGFDTKARKHKTGNKNIVKNTLEGKQVEMDRARSSNGVVAYAIPSSLKVGKVPTDAEVEQTFSGMSLEYSTDGSSAFFFQDQGSLIGQNLVPQGEGTSVGPALSSSNDSDSLIRSGGDTPGKETIPKVNINNHIHGRNRHSSLGKGSSSNSSSEDNDSLLRDNNKKTSELKQRSVSDDSDSLLHHEDNHNVDRYQEHNSQSIDRVDKNHSPSGKMLRSPYSRKDTESTDKNHSPSGKKLLSPYSREDTESTANTSIQESTSGSTQMSIIPTDEELYAIGWAKALDAASGNYYYFTLDRTKTVWENPLSNNNDGTNSSVWGDGTNSEVTSSDVVSVPYRRLQTQQYIGGRTDP